MMTLNLMKQFFDSVSANGTSPIADAIAARWFAHGDAASVRCVRASANFIFHVETPARDYFLRFNHSSERTVPFIAAELDFIAYLAQRGIHAAQLLCSLAGNFIESVTTSLGTFHAVLFEAMPGKHWEIEQLEADDLQQWGKALAELHTASAGFETTARPSWRDHIEMARHIIPPTNADAWDELAFLETTLGALPTTPANFGVIHYDFELDNLKWDRDKPGIVDFDDCARYWFAADIAFALRDLFDDRAEKLDLANERFLAFVKGYRTIKPITDQELRPIPFFLRLHNLVTFAKLIHALAGAPLPDDPAWTTKLRQRLGGKIDQYRASIQNFPIRALRV